MAEIDSPLSQHINSPPLLLLRRRLLLRLLLLVAGLNKRGVEQRKVSHHSGVGAPTLSSWGVGRGLRLK